MSNFIKYFFLSVFLFNSKLTLQAQFQGFLEIPDSLIVKSYQSLYNEYYNSIHNRQVNWKYATAFLKKAYIEKDTLNIANGYYMITYHTDETNLVFNDSLLKYSSLLPEKESNTYAWYAYQGMGDYYFNERNFKKSFDNHIKALNSAKHINNIELQNISITNLGLLKERIGKNEEALIDFKENYTYEQAKFNNLRNTDSVGLKTLLNSICLLANSYRLNKQFDSAQYFNRLVFNYMGYKGAERYIAKALVNSAEVSYANKDYLITIDSINKAFPILIEQNNISNIAIAYYLRGMSNLNLNNDGAIKDLVLMDSVFNLNNDLQPSLRNGYLHLTNYFKKRGDISKQLYYVNQLLKFDSIVHDYKIYVTNGVYNDDRKNLLTIQNNLKSEINKSSLNNKIIFSISCLLVSLLVFELFRRRKANKEKLREHQIKFDNLLKNKNINEYSEKLRDDKTTNLEISESLVREIVEN